MVEISQLQRGSMNWRVQQAYRYINQSIFTMFFINLKQDLKKYVQPRASVMADLFTLPDSVYCVLCAQRPIHSPWLGG
jgi:hypothetical protein